MNLLKMAEEQPSQNQCIFCSIISKQVPSYIVYEDDKVIGILDINPVTKGHILLMPKEHIPIFPVMPNDFLISMSKAIQLISQVMLSSLKATGTNVFIANGEVAGQRASHTMVHIVPRYNDDGMIAFHINEVKANEKETERVKEMFVAKLEELSQKSQKKESSLEKQLTEKFETKN